MVTIDGKRIWLISDVHLGVRNGSLRWQGIQRSYFYEFFIPLLKEHRRPGDVLFILGDLFDSRKGIETPTLVFADTLIEDLTRVMPVSILVGNHDCWSKDNTELNSVRPLRRIPNTRVFEEPETVRMSGKTILVMPWRSSHEEEIQCAQTNPADYLFCHADIAGMSFNRYEKITEGITYSALRGFTRVYSGHIHHAQEYGNVRMLGCPYPMTKNDIDNSKGVWVFDVASGSETFYENTHSPRFFRYSFDQMLETPVGEIRESIRDNFVDVIYDSRWSAQPSLFSVMSDTFPEVGTLFQMYGDIEASDRMLQLEGFEGIETFDMTELADAWVETTPYDTTTKDWLKKSFRSLHEAVLKHTLEEEDI